MSWMHFTQQYSWWGTNTSKTVYRMYSGSWFSTQYSDNSVLCVWADRIKSHHTLQTHRITVGYAFQSSDFFLLFFWEPSFSSWKTFPSGCSLHFRVTPLIPFSVSLSWSWETQAIFKQFKLHLAVAYRDTGSQSHLGHWGVRLYNDIIIDSVQH